MPLTIPLIDVIDVGYKRGTSLIDSELLALQPQLSGAVDEL